jgi:PhzF family phenazine biosynthesis protein
MVELLQYAAFTADPAGGNPAGVVLSAEALSDPEMLSIAADLGYSETAFFSRRGQREFDVRYFSPLIEVPFCGHATIAAAIAFAEHHGTGALVLHTRAGTVEVLTTERGATLEATLTTVEPQTVALSDPDLDRLLQTLGWARDALDVDLPVRVAYAGAWHPIVAVRSRSQLASLSYDFDALSALMADRGWTTVDLVWRESTTVFHARNPFPPGGVVEDPATGAAAGAFGGYLRELRLVSTPSTITIHQGDDLGRPSVLTVQIPTSGGIGVAGTAVRI